MNQPIVLVGAGPMALQYQKVLAGMEVPYVVVGRGESSANNFKEQTGVDVITGGLSKYLAEHDIPEKAIVSTGVEVLGSNVRELLDAGCKSILVEKPAGLDGAEIEELATKVEEHNASVFVAYNRRFYQSVDTARQMIKEDGGLTSMHFEFTEVGWKIKDIHKAPGVKENWFLANSTHVVDLAFFVAGKPAEMSSFRSGTTEWHPTAAQFTGAGKTDKGCLFSYHANWDGPGRWSLDFVTPKRRLILAPMEGLKIQPLGSFAIEDYDLPASPDNNYKPGLFQQTEAFIKDANDDRLCTLQDTVESLIFYRSISGYQ
jgi:predicted dehydrogenase